MANNPKHKDNLKAFKKGHDKRRDNNGRKKKIYTILKEKGYSKDDIAACFSELGFYTLSETQELCMDETKPIIMQIIAKCFIKAYEDGDWSKCKDIIDQTLGKATQKHEVSNLDAMFSNLKIIEDDGKESGAND